MWKKLKQGVGRRSSNKSAAMANVVEEAVEKNNRGRNNGKKKIEPRERTTTDPKLSQFESDEMKDVLNLFNKLEELIVEGDPRVRDVLERRPIVQHALNEEGNATDRSEFSPRVYVPKLNLGSPRREPTFLREVSGVSGQPTMYKDKQLTVSDLGVRSPHQKGYLQNRYQSNNPVIVQQSIPENSTLSNTYNLNNYAGGKMRRHPDGTLITSTNGTTIIEGRANDPNPAFTQVQAQKPFISQAERPKGNPTQLVEPQSDYHQFNYDTPRGKSSVQVKLRGDDKSHDFNYVNEEAGYQVRVSLDNLPEVKKDGNAENAFVKSGPPAPQLRNPLKEIALPVKREPMFAKRTNAAGWTEAVSKVITSEGGEIECFGSKITFPKMTVPNKALIRVSVLDIHSVPYRSAKTAASERSPAILPISAALKIEPENLVLQKPITVRLMTSIAMQNEEETVNTVQSKRDRNKNVEKDIKTNQILIKHHNSTTGDTWQDLETEVFRSADSVMFRMDELSSVCAFHIRDSMESEVLIKKLAVYIFQSLETRKNQFLSVLVCEDLPHVMQKGVEGMPGWLHYMDSCFNVSMEEGRNLVIYLEPSDRGLCSVDANKMEIPWENLWHPECIIRKHFHVTLHKRDIEASVQLLVNEGNFTLNTAFVWQVQRRPIFLPDPVPAQSYTLQPDTSWKEYDNNSQRPREESNLYKHVSWKPPTPDPPFVTNESLLKYATM